MLLKARNVQIYNIDILPVVEYPQYLRMYVWERSALKPWKIIGKGKNIFFIRLRTLWRGRKFIGNE
jgi:hypothetical protein